MFSTALAKVNFLGVETSSHEVWILRSQRDSTTVLKGLDGKYTTSLKRLVPAALVQFSPAKGICGLSPALSKLSNFALGERQYTLSITGSTGNPYGLGTMEQFLSGHFPEVLDLVEADTCTLSPDESDPGVLICHLMLKAKKSDNVRTLHIGLMLFLHVHVL